VRGAILADDLTGACDSAARAAGAGWRVAVELTGPAAHADIVVVSTGSRRLTHRQAAERAAQAAARLLERQPEIFYKKIDSTLRGSWREEIAAVAALLGAPRIVLCPAFPACGRVVRGRQVLAGGELSGELSFDNAEIPDAVTERDLAEIARSYPRQHTLWAGSGGLARYVFGNGPHPPQVLPRARRWVVVAGSHHPRTQEQVEWWQAQRAPEDRLLSSRAAVDAAAPGTGYFVCGGDTASYLMELLAAESIDVAGEAEPGIAAGILRGGPASGATIVTKAGGFGRTSTIADVLGILRS
jgi:uncharacterized protein YgbK (DUF1537 family)